MPNLGLGHLPRLTLIELMLGQSLSAATILWTELSQEGKCEPCAEELVDLIVATLTQLEQLHNCLKGKK